MDAMLEKLIEAETSAKEKWMKARNTELPFTKAEGIRQHWLSCRKARQEYEAAYRESGAERADTAGPHYQGNY